MTTRTDPQTPLHELFAGFGAEFADWEERRLPRACRDLAEEYREATENVLLADGGDRGWIEMEGPDMTDFLQRVLSSDLKKLPPGGMQWSAMLQGKGKWISDLILYRFEREGCERIGLDCPASRTTAVNEALERLHFSEDMRWEVFDGARLLVIGPGAGDALATVGWPAAAVLGSANGEPAVHAAPEALLLDRPDRGRPCRELLGSPQLVRMAADCLAANGATPGGFAALEVLRVEAFLPRFGADFDADSTLPEANEWRRASVSKGCYAGQEVVAKINTYGEAPWQLCRLTSEGPAASMAGAELREEDGRAVGEVTSWAHAPGRPAPVGLGRLRKRAAIEGHRLVALKDGEEAAVQVHVPRKVLG